ncbi:hypothetical protein CF335_g3492 [Tilletia laevis]|nr:hypothetical protein CF335_g3492 [Tilletia laevis]
MTDAHRIDELDSDGLQLDTHTLQHSTEQGNSNGAMDTVRVVPDVSSSITASSKQQQDISPWLFEDPATSPSPSPASASVPLALTPSSSSRRLPAFASSSNIKAQAAAQSQAAAAAVPPTARKPSGSTASSRPSSRSAAATLNPSSSANSFASRPITPPRAAAFASFSLNPHPRPVSRDGGPKTPASSAAAAAAAAHPYTSLYPHGDHSSSTSSTSSFSASPFPHRSTPDRRNASSTTLGLDSILFRRPSSAGGGLASASATHLPPSSFSSSSSSSSPPAQSPVVAISGTSSATNLPTTAAGTGSTPQKRSKNPFNFLKKKGSSILTGKDHQSPTGASPTSSRLLGGSSSREAVHGRVPSGSHPSFHAHSLSPDIRHQNNNNNNHQDFPNTPSSLSLASTAASSVNTVQGPSSSPRTTSNSFSHGSASASASALTLGGSGSGPSSGGTNGSGSALQPPFSLSSMYNRLHHGHSDHRNSGSTTNTAAGSSGSGAHTPTSGSGGGGGPPSSSRHASSGHHHSFLNLHLGGHGHGHGHSHSHLHPSQQQQQSAMGLDQEHLLEPEQIAAQSSSGKNGNGGNGGERSSHRPGRLRLGVRPRTRDKDSQREKDAHAAGHFSPPGAGGGGGGGDDDINAFAAALGERYGGGHNDGTASAGTSHHAAAFPFGPGTPSAEIDFSLDTNFDQIDDIVDQNAARRALGGRDGGPNGPGMDGQGMYMGSMEMGGDGAGFSGGGFPGMEGGGGGEDGFGRGRGLGMGMGMGALPLPKPLPSQLQSAADDKQAAELARAERARAKARAREGSAGGNASVLMQGGTSGADLAGVSPRTNTGTQLMSNQPVSEARNGNGRTFTRHPSLEGRTRSSSVSFLETMNADGNGMTRLGSYTGDRTLGSIGGSSSSVEALALPGQVGGGEGGSQARGTGAGAGAGAHPNLVRLHSGPSVPSSSGFRYSGSGAQFGLGSGMRAGMRRVSLAEGALPAAARYGKSDQSGMSALTEGSLGSSSFITPGSSITSAATGLDSRASAESSGVGGGGSGLVGQGKVGLHGQSLSTASAPPGSVLYDRVSAGGMQLKSLREFDGSVAAGAGADALERSRMAQIVSLRKGSGTSAGSRRSGISPKSSFANLPGTSRDGQPSNVGGWTLPSLAAGLADPSYKFPARLNSLGGKPDSSFTGTSSGGTADSLGLRKASAGTGTGSSSAGGMSTTPSVIAPSSAPARAAQASTTSTTSSTAWMAPDSWAVQPDSSKVDLNTDDEDTEESEQEGPQHSAGPSGVSGKFDFSGRRRRSSSAMSNMTGGAYGGGDGDVSRSATFDANLQAPGSSYLADGRWGQRKDSVGTEAGLTGTASPRRRPSDIEILDSNDAGDGLFGDGLTETPVSPTSVFLQQQQSQSSHVGGKGDYQPSISSSSQNTNVGVISGRGGGGAANVSAGAAAVAVAAAGKFLHRPHRHRNARPSTAGSLHSTFRAQMGVAVIPPSSVAPASGNLNENGGGGLGVNVDGLPGGFGPGSSAHRPSVGGSSEDGSVAAYVPPSVVTRERENSGFVGRRPNTAMSQGGVSFTGSIKQAPFCVRIHRTDGPPYTIMCMLSSTAAEIRTMIRKKFGNSDAAAYRLFVRDKGSERPLGPSERPALIQKRRLEQAGYNETDSLENMGRSDLSYLLRFVYRLDSVPTFDSESFGNDEHTFQHLHLQGRNLEMVPIFLYRHADWIVSLDLSGNPMSDIPLDFIQACTNLRSIRLSNLALKRVPQSLRQSETLTYIDVSNNRIPDLSHIALDGAAELLSFKVQNNRLTELPSYFARIETLRYLNISNNRFETFPMVLCDMPFLVDLDISFNTISSLPHDIGRMVKLQRLALVGNALEALPDSISELVSLESVDVRRNLLQDVSVLFRLPNLQSLQISHNNLKNVDAEFGSRLTSLDFGQNQLTKVKIVVPAASELTVLNLTSADIDKFDESLFSQLPNLTDLVLDGNRQFSDLTESVGELRSLVRLSCNNTRLGKLPEAIGKLSKLKVLEVHNNNIKIIPASIWNCGELEYINVSANIVTSFPFPPVPGSVDGGDAKTVGVSAILTASPTVQQERKGSGTSFTNTPWAANGATLAPLSVSLKKLRLCDNRLTDEVFNVLSRFVCLEVLNLSFNEIYEVPAARLSKNVRLQELYLSGNSLSSIPAEDIMQLRDLQTLYINGNKLQTLPAELGQLRKLVNLDVGNNNLKYNIANWNYDWNWNSNIELRFLNLSGNKRLEIKYKTEMVNGRQKNISDFSRLTNLRLLGLMDVTFTVQSTPDESDNRRVRTSLSQINEMAYGIADTLGKHDSLSIVDVVIPHFRKMPNECLFGLFAGRGHGSLVGSRIANHLAEWVGPRVEWEHKRMSLSGDYRAMHDVLRRAFLRLNKELADMLMSEGLRQDSEIARVDDGKPAVSASMGTSARHHWCSGASAVLAYMVDRTLYIANAGDALAVISRNRGDAHLVSSKHDPSFRDEAMRIRSAEGWVSLRGYVNDRIDVSRSFGYYHLFPIVNAAPAVSTIELTDSDEFIILANRTLWDHMSYQTAVDVARMERDDPMLAAQKLRDFAISFGAEESFMVMVVSVADLFYDRQQRRAATNDLNDKHERPRFRRDLPGDRVLARLPMEIPAPIGQLALVFTDIKNSTSLWETNPGMHAAIRLHTSLLRRQLHIIGGYEVKTEGDAFMVSFPTISSAMNWCFATQLQLLQQDWPQEILECEDGKEVFDSAGELIYRGLSVRMGIHWGAPVCEQDPVSNRMDYFGPIVNRAARISGAADGGQIMASKDVVAELKAVLDSFDETTEAGVEGDGALASYRLLQPGISRDVVQLRRLGFGISEVGERKLKGLETPEMLYMVYPTALAGRMEEKPDAPAPQVFEPTIQLLNIDEVKHLGSLCLRLEALSSGHVFPGIGGLGLDESTAPTVSTHGELAPGRARSPKLSIEDKETNALQSSTHTLMPMTVQVPPGPEFGDDDPDSRRKVVEGALALHPELLVYALRDDATDDEMARIMDQLTTRIHNALSSLVLRRAAQSQGLGMDLFTQKLLAGLLQG